MPKISIIILNWNGWEDTIECLESLYRINYPNYEVIVVDNFSTNDSIQNIKGWTEGKIEVESKYFETTKCTHNIKIFEYTKADLENNSYLERKKEFDTLESNEKLFLLKNDKNDGFAGWNNIALKQILKENISEYVFLLNNDTIIDKNLFIELFESIKNISSENIWLIWPKIFNYFTNTHQIKFYGKLNEKITKVDWVSWAAFLVKTDVLRNVWLFDETFFLYWEDTDLCYRVTQKYQNYYIQTQSKIYHKIESSSQNVSQFKITLHIRNLFILLRRYKKFTLKELVISILHIVKNNIKINFFKTIYYVVKWLINWIIYFIKNPNIKF